MYWCSPLPARRLQPVESYNPLSFSSFFWKGSTTPFALVLAKILVCRCRPTLFSPPGTTFHKFSDWILLKHNTIIWKAMFHPIFILDPSISLKHKINHHCNTSINYTCKFLLLLFFPFILFFHFLLWRWIKCSRISSSSISTCWFWSNIVAAPRLQYKHNWMALHEFPKSFHYWWSRRDGVQETFCRQASVSSPIEEGHDTCSCSRGSPWFILLRTYRRPSFFTQYAPGVSYYLVHGKVTNGFSSHAMAGNECHLSVYQGFYHRSANTPSPCRGRMIYPSTQNSSHQQQ